MEGTNAIAQLTDQAPLDALTQPLSDAIKNVYGAGGTAGQAVKNAIHGVWLGHPLHPVLTDVPLGAWTTGFVLDVAASATDNVALENAADIAIAVGLAGAVGAAVTGLTDWSETDGRAKRTGLIHGLMNIAATTLYAMAYMLRTRGSRTEGTSCAIAGYALAVGSAYLGGDLVYDQRIGVTHADPGEAPQKFTTVAKSPDVEEGSMIRAEHDGTGILLARRHGRVCALAHSCSHLGGPLSEGTLKENSVVCPWHGSEFALDDGHVINGPATENQPCLKVRETEGRIQVKQSPSS